MGTYRVEKNHPLVHDFEVICHRHVVVLKLVHQVTHLDVFNFDYERVWQLGVLRRNHEVVCLGNQHFYVVKTVTKIVVSIVQSLLFDNLIGSEMSSLHWILASLISLLLWVE